MTIGDIGARLWFHPEVRGLELLPPDGPVLVVGTRSGGRFNVELAALTSALGPAGPAGRAVQEASTAAEAAAALDAGSVVLVQPGGDRDAHRPSWEPPSLDPAATAELVRPALDRGVPVVSLVTDGGQDTALFLTRGDAIAHRLRLDRVLGVAGVPVSIALPWGLNVGDIAGHVPLPARIVAQLSPPLAITDRLGPGPDPAAVARWVAAEVRSTADALADLRRGPPAVARRVARTGRALAGTGLVRPMRPDTVVRAARGLARGGIGPAGAYGYAAARFPDEPAIVDDAGTITFGRLAPRVEAVAASMHDAGIGPDSRVGVLCRNHSGFVEAVAAAARLGADVVLLNTAFAGPQLADVLRTEGVTALVHDGDLGQDLADADVAPLRFVAWPGAERSTEPSLDDLAAAGAGRHPPVRPTMASRYVLLTSGTTGRPRGAARPTPLSADPLVALLSRIPLRHRDVTLVASPLFHAWGFAHLGLGMVLSSTMVLQRRFDPEATLAAIERHHVRVLVAVPVMLQRLVELPDDVRRRYDTSSLEVVAASGSALPGDLALRFMDQFGDVLHNLYGSTEAAWAGIATPYDLRSAPGTAGRPPQGAEVHILDDDGDDVAPGQTGRIAVRNSMAQAGPTTTGDSLGPVPPGLVATGDLGHLDHIGRLYVDGRQDDMIVSGGENVYPQEVEDVLASHPAVADVVVVGVPDVEFGQRLKAIVVRRPGASVGAAELRAHVRHRLARFKVPREVEFVAELPRNSTGKALRRDLRGGA